jgi:hypothetical protein
MLKNDIILNIRQIFRIKLHFWPFQENIDANLMTRIHLIFIMKHLKIYKNLLNPVWFELKKVELQKFLEKMPKIDNRAEIWGKIP